MKILKWIIKNWKRIIFRLTEYLIAVILFINGRYFLWVAFMLTSTSFEEMNPELFKTKSKDRKLSPPREQSRPKN